MKSYTKQWKIYFSVITDQSNIEMVLSCQKTNKKPTTLSMYVLYILILATTAFQ